jgi:hypothetical protein
MRLKNWKEAGWKSSVLEGTNAELVVSGSSFSSVYGSLRIKTLIFQCG